MNKNKITMSVIGGVAVVITLVVGYLVYAAWEEKEENLDQLESTKATVKRISSAKIAPGQASVDAIGENHKNLAIWFDKAFDVAARGDKAFSDDISVAEFCNILREEAAEKRNLPEDRKDKIASEEFDFGFGDILGGKIPDKDQLPLLQRQWDDIKLFVDTLSGCGIVKLVKIERMGKKPVEAAPTPAPNMRGRNQPKQEEVKPLADDQSYTVIFQARPLALVKAVNEFAKTERFVVVDSFAFERDEDALGAKLSGKDKEAAAQQPRRRRRRGAAAEEETPAEGAEEAPRQTGVVVDPATDVPFTVEMKITTYDFGTKAAGAAGEAKEGEEAEK